VSWLSGWTYRKKFTPPHSASALSDVPLILPIVDDADIGAGAAFSDCRDFRITRADGTTLVDPLRVTAPAISGGVCNGLLHVIGDVSAVVDEPLYLYYGAAGVSAPWVTTLPHTGCVGWWGMESASPPDWSGNGNNGTGVNGGSGLTAATGKVGSAINFDGVDDYINVGGRTDLDTTYLTMSAWVKTSDAHPSGSNGTLVSKWGAQRDYIFWFLSGDVLLGDSNSDELEWTNGESVVVDGHWHHLLVIKDGYGGSIWCDGTERASKDSGFLLSIPSPDTDVIIGSYSGGSGGKYGGLIDDVRIYSRVFSADEISYCAALPDSPGTWGAEETAPVTSRPWLWARGQRTIGGGVI